MKRDWSYDSPVISKANLAADFIFLNLVYLLCCLPVVTIGPANAAMAGVFFSLINGEDAGVRAFLRLFRKNLKTFLLPWIGVLLLGVLVLFDAYLLFRQPVSGTVIFSCVLILLLVLYAMILSHICMIHAKFDCKFLHMISNAVLLTLAHPLRTVLLLVLQLLPISLFFFWPRAFVFLTPVWLLCYCTLSACAMAKIMAPVYNRLAEGKK